MWKNTSEEVHLDMKNKMSENRIHINPQHSLIINNFTANDTGLYSCQGLEQQERENKYDFLTDRTFFFLKIPQLTHSKTFQWF